MRERRGRGGQNLEERVHVLCTVVVVRGVRVALVSVAGQQVALGLCGDDVLLDAVEERPLGQVEQDGRLVPLALWPLQLSRCGNGLGLGLNVGLLSLELGRGRGSIAVGEGSSVLLDVIGVGRVRAHLLGLNLLARLVARVVVLNDLNIGRTGWNLATLEQEGALWDVPPLKCPVALDNLAPEVRQEEDGDEESDTARDAEDGSGDFTIGELDAGGGTLPDDEYWWISACDTQLQTVQLTSQEAGCQSEVEGNGVEGLLDRVRPQHNAVLGDEEDDRRKDTCDARRTYPGKEDGRDTLDAPVDGPRARGGNAHADDGAHDRMRGAYGETEPRSECQVDRRGHNSTDHAEQEHGRVVLEELRLDDLCADRL